ncbi:MAG TPA: amidohydrolase family protein [Rhizomicrobium sp.]
MEDIIEPDLPIIDPHHHLWDLRPVLQLRPRTAVLFEELLRGVPLYLFDELRSDLASGHNIRATVFLECHAMYRGEGPEWLRCVGETEFVNGVAAMSASGLYGSTRVCAGIVGSCDLRQHQSVRETLEAHIAAGGGRFRGIRQGAAWDGDPTVLGAIGRVGEGLFLDSDFRKGFAQLEPLGLTFDAWLLQPQLPELVDLARAFPETQIVLDHVGAPLGIGVYEGRREELFADWRNFIRELGRCENVCVKLGGLAMPFPGFASYKSQPPASSQQLAREWKPYIETCIEAFGPARAMFESNFPVDSGSCSYAVLWNALKRLAQGCSRDEKAALFAGTAARIYRLDVP